VVYGLNDLRTSAYRFSSAIYIGNSESSVVFRGRGVVKWVGSKQYVIDFFDFSLLVYGTTVALRIKLQNKMMSFEQESHWTLAL